MPKTLAALFAGTLAGVLLTLLIRPGGEEAATDVVRDIVDVPKLSARDTERLRGEQFASLVTIEEVYGLPTGFARAEALYALAGRSDATTVQRLIFDANRIADEVDRNGALQILFSRLAEQDPQSALALARTDYFRGVRSIEETVWRQWARMNLDDAIRAVNAEPDGAARTLAVQSLYDAYGYLGNATTDQIEASTGVGPNRRTRARYLYQLADRSPAEAIAWINSIESFDRRSELGNWLAWYLAEREPDAAERYAELFENSAMRTRYRSTVTNVATSGDPKLAVDRILAGPRDAVSRGGLHNAFRALAAEDLETAKQYFRDATSAEDKQTFGAIIARELAGEDIELALAWAEENDTSRFRRITMAVLEQLARQDPERAFAEAGRRFDPQTGNALMSSLVSRIAYFDPENAAVYVDRIDNRQQRSQAKQQLAQNWVQRDPEAAMRWIMAQDDDVRPELLENAGQLLARTNIDLALRMLPELDEAQQLQWRQQIAHRLVSARSPAEAEQFISQFEGQPGFEALRSSVINGVAESDVQRAWQMAELLAPGPQRDSTYANLVTQQAETDPTKATAWLEKIDDESYRGMATGTLVSIWVQQDPVAAMNWVQRLPTGRMRDNAILNMSYTWREPTPSQQAMIESIESEELRQAAIMRQIYTVMRSDPGRARQMLEEAELSTQQRQQIEMMFNNSYRRY